VTVKAVTFACLVALRHEPGSGSAELEVAGPDHGEAAILTSNGPPMGDPPAGLSPSRE